jgi:hypothetical protein
LLEQEDEFLESLYLRPGYYEAKRKLHPWKSGWSYVSRNQKAFINSKLKGLRNCEIQDIINEELSWEKN